MMDLSSVGLYKLHFDAAEQLEAADGRCSSFGHTAVAFFVCASESCVSFGKCLIHMIWDAHEAASVSVETFVCIERAWIQCEHGTV